MGRVAKRMGRNQTTHFQHLREVQKPRKGSLEVRRDTFGRGVLGALPGREEGERWYLILTLALMRTASRVLVGRLDLDILCLGGSDFLLG